MNSVNFIAMQLKEKYLQNLKPIIHQGINEICAFTGEKITEGIKKKDLISTTFTDFEYIKFKSEWVSIDIALCMEYVIPNEKGTLISLRFKSFYVSEKGIRFLNRDNLEDLIFNIPDSPFIIAVSFGFKKHISFKSKINFSTNKFIVSTDKGLVEIDRSKIDELYQIMKKWYTIVEGKEGTSQEPTYFTKDDIMHGCSNYMKIEQYGDTYFIENDYISKFRNTFLLEFLCHILNKRSKNNA